MIIAIIICIFIPFIILAFYVVTENKVKFYFWSWVRKLGRKGSKFSKFCVAKYNDNLFKWQCYMWDYNSQRENH